MSPTPSELASVARIVVPRTVIDETWKALRAFGNEGCEGFVLWLGHVERGAANIKTALVPTQESIRGEDGVGYFVNSQTLFELNRELHRSGLRLLAQVHSHPTDAYHSLTDDAYAVVTTEGGFSIVVPDFAVDDPDPTACAIYRLREGRWRELRLRDVAAMVTWGE
jgi:JAB domain-containing protein similar to deubiquitination enzymes